MLSLVNNYSSHMTRILLLLIILITIGSESMVNQINDDLDWELSKSKDGISVYTRKVSFSNYKEFKGEVVVVANPEQVISILKNIDGYKEWLPDCLESKMLKKMDESQQMNYIHTDVPWPYDDRDLIYKFTVTDKINTKQIIISIENKPEYIESVNGIVRIPSAQGLWIITPTSKNKTKLVYQMHVEPGGYVPAWLANLKITDTPYGFLYNLRKQLEK
ncbi:MAG: START domain protein [Marinilabiliales bacterium]|nr:MAG: START domain protein [Marinilabiliales bacterium]